MIRTLFPALISMMFMASPVLAQTAAGDWNGVVAMRMGEVRVAVHLQAEPDGVLVGTADSPDQGGFHAILTNIQASADDLSFDLPIAASHFDGHWDAATRQWTGFWNQDGDALALNLHRGRLPKPELRSVKGLDGDWTGVVAAEPSMKLRLTYHIRTDARGTTVLSENPDHLANGETAESVARIGDHVVLSMNDVDGLVQAYLSDDGQVMIGALTQAGQQYPLRLIRAP